MHTLVHRGGFKPSRPTRWPVHFRSGSCTCARCRPIQNLGYSRTGTETAPPGWRTLPRAIRLWCIHPLKRSGETMFCQCVRLLIRLVVHSTGVIVIIAICSAPIASSGQIMASNDDKEITVWAISSSKTYHCPGSRWYGKTEEGKYMSECEAIRTGFRPAFGRECGSQCKH